MMNSPRSFPLSFSIVIGVIVLLIVALGATGYALYQEKQKPSGVEISIGKGGLKIEEK